MLEAAWLIPALPLAGFATLVLLGRRLGDPAAGWLATLAMAGSFLASCVVFAGLVDLDAHSRSYTQELFSWIAVGGFSVDAAFLVDPLSVTMALFVTGIGTLIHLYSIGYMHGDDGFARFFTYLNLFAFSMLVLVLGDNLLLTFLGWEGVGACSYLLISFWFTRDTAASAGKKAFVTNRVGDFGFMTAMFVAFFAFGSVRYREMFEILEEHPIASGTAAAIGLLLLLGAAGKSAQLPLYVWLPDAMEGPTPVSALIHAATMVTAGVYVLARMNPVLALAPDVLTAVAVIGGLTALFAATIACAQDDIKRVLAYSTISQLGYMFLAVGTGAYVAAIFHMVTHAFFKALLFLGAGSVIHGLHDEQDIKRMGNLRRWMPITFATYLLGWLAICGIPPFSGFWSKDDILLNAFDRHIGFWVIGAATALLTAYYMSRQVFLVFYGEDRWRTAAPVTPAEAEATPEHEPAAAGGHADEHAGAHAEPHESPWTMWVPLAVLAVLSVLGGVLNLPFTGDTLVLEHWLEPVFEGSLRHVDVGTGTKILLAVVAAGLAVAGIVAARVWIARPARPELEPGILRRAWGVDALYAAVIERPGHAAADLSAATDRTVIDGAVNGVATLVRGGGDQLRKVQTGYVRNYALSISVGTVLVLAYVLFRSM